MSELVSLIERLRTQLKAFQAQVLTFLDHSTIMEFRNDPGSPLVFMNHPPYYWGPDDEEQKRLQMQLLKDYNRWFEQLELLLRDAPDSIRKRIRDAHHLVTAWLQRENDWSIPDTIEAAKATFLNETSVFYEVLDLFDRPGASDIVLVPDTNALIAEPDVARYSDLTGTKRYTIVIVPTVLAELDKLKVLHRDPKFRKKVASVIRRLKGMRQQGSLLKGVTVHKTVTVKMIAQEPKFEHTLQWLDPSNDDDRVIASAFEVQLAHPSSVVILVTADVNLQNKAEMANLPFAEPPGPGEAQAGSAVTS